MMSFRDGVLLRRRERLLRVELLRRRRRLLVPKTRSRTERRQPSAPRC